ncbi:MAG: RlmI/RlmK family 23S rRNA methyltransferase, partial [Paenisporosarcina sp.]|nr:RlmI/RlmK family 23S rRNA methyltransferase [Paenisporosarcina sp.]
MKKSVQLKVKSNYAKNIKAGYPLIMEEAVINLKDVNVEGTIIELFDDNHHFLGKGYYGKQNKGRGWVLSQNQQE